MLHWTALIAAGLFVAASPAGAPGPRRAQEQQPTFRASVELVEVDAIVRDADGTFVRGLSADDFEIYEDGKLQSVESFYLVGGSSSDGRRPAPDALFERQADRVFVFLFDEGHLTNEGVQRLRKAIDSFLSTEFGAGDVGGVFHDGQMANGRLTSVRAELRAALRAVKPASETRASRMAVFREFPRINGEYEAARIEAGDARTLANAAQQNCHEDPDLCRQEGGLDLVENRLQQNARYYVNQARAATSRTLRNLALVATGLAGLPGRKTVVLLTDGFFVDESQTALQQIAGQAARNGVTMYAIDGRGTTMTGGSELPDASTAGAPVSTAFDTSDGGAQILAASTGGFVVRGTDDFTRALGRIASDTSTYYVLGYAPDARTLDGKLRRIEVRLKDRDLSVRARKGYLATPLPPRGAGR